MRVTLVIPALGSGGAERVISEIANYLAEKGHTVDIITLSSGLSVPFYPLNSKIILHQLNLFCTDKVNFFIKIKTIFYRIYKLRKKIIACDPNIILSFIDIMNITTLLATRGTGIPVIVSERIDPNFHYIPQFYNWLRKKLYIYSYRIVVQTQSAFDYFSSNIKQKSVIIENPCMLPSNNDKKINIIPRFIVTIGRLETQKDHQTLIYAMPQVIAKYPNLILKIYGEGSLQNKLQKLIDCLCLTKNIKLMGAVHNVKSCLQQADLFVFPSKYEGFPNALLEAIAVGVPCIATRISGNTEIIDDKVNGLLFDIGDIPTLSNLIINLLKDSKTRVSFSQAAQYKADLYSPEKILSQWESLLLSSCTS